jgi:hypothetical protein
MIAQENTVAVRLANERLGARNAESPTSEAVMKKIIIGLSCLLMALVGIALVGQLFSQPPDIQITPAYHDVDPAIAALSGVW